MIAIETNQLLNSRAKTCHDILTVAGEHAATHNEAAEGIVCMMFALLFAAEAYGMTPRELSSSLKKSREIISKAKVFAGDGAGIRAVVFEAGVN